MDFTPTYNPVTFILKKTYVMRPNSSAMNGAEINTFKERVDGLKLKGVMDAKTLADKLVIRDREVTGLELWKPATGVKIGACLRSFPRRLGGASSE